MKAIDENMTNQEAISVFKAMTGGDTVSQKDITNYFKANKIKITGTKGST